MNLREEIASAISKECGVDYDFTLQGQYDAADAILAKVREALLSNEVHAPIRHELHHYPRTSTRDTVKTVIEMALDAVATDYPHHS